MHITFLFSVLLSCSLHDQPACHLTQSEASVVKASRKNCSREATTESERVRENERVLLMRKVCASERMDTRETFSRGYIVSLLRERREILSSHRFVSPAPVKRMRHGKGKGGRSPHPRRVSCVLLSTDDVKRLTDMTGRKCRVWRGKRARPTVVPVSAADDALQKHLHKSTGETNLINTKKKKTRRKEGTLTGGGGGVDHEDGDGMVAAQILFPPAFCMPFGM